MTVATEPQTIASELLARVRAEPGCADAAYAEVPAEIVGGYDTSIFSFRLSGVAAPWDGPLILRLFRPAQVDRPRIETAIQNTVVDMGYPCPRALLDGGEGRIGGRPYMIMERLSGKPLLSYITSPGRMTLRVTPILAEAHTRLHALDAPAFRDGLIARGLAADDLAGMTFDAEFAQVEEAASRLNVAALTPVLSWLREHRPQPRVEVLCHGDFHPMNVIVDVDGSYGVIDWTLPRIAEPEYDVARTVLLWRRAPISDELMRGPLRLLIGLGRRVILWRYKRLYRARRPIDAERLRYYEAFAAARLIVTTLDDTNTTLWRQPGVLDGLAAHVRQCTGLRLAHVSIPPLTAGTAQTSR